MTDGTDPTDSAASRSAIPHDTAIAHVPSHVLLWVVAAVTLGLDLWSKAWAFRTLKPDDAPEYLFGLITFRRSLNPGALFGMGEGLVFVFIIASVVALAFVLYLFACSSRRHHVLHVGLAFILAGALGNLYDRVVIQVDRVSFKANPGGAVVFVGEIEGDRDADPIKLRPWSSDEPFVSHPRDQIESIQTIGVVRDFIKFEPRLLGLELWPWVFNVADMLLTVGVGVLLVCFWRMRGHPQTRGNTCSAS